MLPQDIDKLKAAFGDQAFSGRDLGKVLGIEPRGTGGAFKYLLNRGVIRRIKSGAYQFTGGAIATPATVAPVVASELVCKPPVLVRAGELYLHERLLLIADVARQEGSAAVRLYSTIIEIDPASKHPRNKIVNFIQSRDPREYAQVMAWLDSLAGNPPPAVDDTALELAAELERQLIVAKKEIAELKAKLDIIRGAV